MWFIYLMVVECCNFSLKSYLNMSYRNQYHFDSSLMIVWSWNHPTVFFFKKNLCGLHGLNLLNVDWTWIECGLNTDWRLDWMQTEYGLRIGLKRDRMKTGSILTEDWTWIEYWTEARLNTDWYWIEMIGWMVAWEEFVYTFFLQRSLFHYIQ